jgi:mannose-6-phosphate isomerase-like protein (cupin superfamily)
MSFVSNVSALALDGRSDCVCGSWDRNRPISESTGSIPTAMRNRQVNLATPTTEPEAQSINHENESEWSQTRPGERCLIRISAADTNGAYSVVEIVSDARDGTPMHIHQNEDEHFVILEGTARIASGEEILDAAAGTSITLRRGVPHAWCNPSNSRLRMVVIASPGGCEEILRLIAKGGNVDIMALFGEIRRSERRPNAVLLTYARPSWPNIVRC